MFVRIGCIWERFVFLTSLPNCRFTSSGKGDSGNLVSESNKKGLEQVLPYCTIFWLSFSRSGSGICEDTNIDSFGGRGPFRKAGGGELSRLFCVHFSARGTSTTYRHLIVCNRAAYSRIKTNCMRERESVCGRERNVCFSWVFFYPMYLVIESVERLWLRDGAEILDFERFEQASAFPLPTGTQTVHR